MLLFLFLITTAFCLLGFVIGIWAQNFEQLQIIPMLIVTPLTFLGGAFYSINALGEPWRTVTLFNPVVYLDQRLPLDLLRRRRRAGLVQRGGDAGDHRRLPHRHRLGVQDRLPAQAVAVSRWSARSRPFPSRFWATKSQLMMFSSTLFTNFGRSLR